MVSLSMENNNRDCGSNEIMERWDNEIKRGVCLIQGGCLCAVDKQLTLKSSLVKGNI